jgi:hypothetical protein
MTKKVVLGWESIGIVLIFLMGSALHFVFEWSGHWRPLAWVAPVNESTWEHFKLGFWPGLLFALVEYRVIKGSVNNFWVGKSLGLFSMPIVVAALFYGYTAVLGENYLVVDILIFLLSVVVGQLISYKVLTAAEMNAVVRRIAVVGLVIMMAAFSLFSYSPPRIFLFKDPETNQYGIVEGYEEHE